jgi:hypothetical protein
MSYRTFCKSITAWARLLGWTFSICLTLCRASDSYCQEPASAPSGQSESRGDVFARVIANEKRMETALDEYERTQKVEIHKTGSDSKTTEVKVWRVFPAGPAVNKLPISTDGNPVNPETYRADLEKLEKYLIWAAQEGSGQQDAYAKAQRKRKERNELIVSTHEAFLFTRVGEEKRSDRMLAKYSMVPNPKYKPTTRNGMVFTKVRGTVWIDEQSDELAKIEGAVIEDISISLFLAKVYKGSHFMQERYEMAPGHWFPTYEQYDFDGRKFVLSFSIHERTFYSDYKRVGPPRESLAVVRDELNKLADGKTAP